MLCKYKYLIDLTNDEDFKEKYSNVLEVNVDITEHFETKCKMFECDESQKQWMADNYAVFSFIAVIP